MLYVLNRANFHMYRKHIEHIFVQLMMFFFCKIQINQIFLLKKWVEKRVSMFAEYMLCKSSIFAQS
jgi:hypothetical protein